MRNNYTYVYYSMQYEICSSKNLDGPNFHCSTVFLKAFLFSKNVTLYNYKIGNIGFLGFWREFTKIMQESVSLEGLTVSYFFLVSRNTKQTETGRCFAKFRSFRETEKNTKIQKRVSSCFAKMRNNVSFRIFVIFLLNFVPPRRVLYLLNQFCAFYSSFVPFIRVSYLFI